MLKGPNAFFQAATLNLGPGAKVQFEIHGQPDGALPGGQFQVTGTANLAGELIIDFRIVPSAAATWVLFRTNSANGINGAFGTVTFLNLNPGYTAMVQQATDPMGNAILQLVLTGTPIEPEWTNPATAGAGREFSTPANWQGGIVPSPGTNARIRNGGIAVANSGMTPPMQVLDFSLGTPGMNVSSGLVSNGVPITTVAS
ncbi:MAG TPA: hypothetical protein VG095_09395, partial [Chthoniobacterales bacterium]|nr:hypothetical protein [Chthoniobacterales bacterium]